MLTYEAQLDSDLEKAFMEGSLHFDEKSAVHKSLRKITSRLKDLNIPYAVVGGMALFSHGVRRFTEDVDILLTPEGLKQTHDELEGLGYVPPFKGSKQLRDAETGVKIEFLVTGQFPGDGKPKPVSFPDPANVGTELDGILYLRLETLIELKLASGMSNAGRLKDLADVQAIIKTLHLELDYEKHLNPYVREKFIEMWNAVANSPADND